jgi:imidazolonepropionase-like amidohydrolase
MRNRILLLAPVTGMLLAGCASAVHAPLQGHHEETAIVGANVLSMESAGVTLDVAMDQTVIVRDGKIVRVGPRRSVTVARGAVVIDGRNRYLIPGLTDMHAHLPAADDALSMEDYLFLEVACGVTTVRAMRGDAVQLALEKRIEAGEVFGPNLLVSSPYLTNDEDFTLEKAEPLLAGYKRDGYGFVKLVGGIKPEIYEGVIAASLRNGLPVMGHVPRAVGLERAIEAGQSDVEHIDPLLQALHEHPADVDRLIRRMAEKKVSTCPDVYWYVVRFHQRELPELMTSTRGLQYIPAKLLAEWKSELTANAADGVRMAANKIKYRDEIASYLTLLGKMNEAGVTVLVSAGDGAFIVPGFGIQEELRLFEQAGLSRADVLRAATRNAAVSAGQESRWGTVSAGKRADLVLLEANPLDDLRNLDSIEGVMVRGRWLPRSELDTGLTRLRTKATASSTGPHSR